MLLLLVPLVVLLSAIMGCSMGYIISVIVIHTQGSPVRQNAGANHWYYDALDKSFAADEASYNDPNYRKAFQTACVLLCTIFGAQIGLVSLVIYNMLAN